MTEKEGISISRGLLEGSDVLNRPIEAGIYDSETDDYLPVAPHWHYYMEIIYVEEGAVLVENDGRNYTVGKGDLIMIRPETIHSILPVTTAHTTYIFTKFDVNCVLAGENSYVPKLGVILRHAAGDPNAPMKLDEERIRSYHFGEHIRRIYDELLAMNYGCDVMARSYLTLLMIKVLRIWRAMGADLDSAIAKDTSDISIHNITAYIDEHVGEDLRVEQLAGLFEDIRQKCESSEISTKALDLRGLLASVTLVENGLRLGPALEMGLVNKSFDDFERQLVADMIRLRIDGALSAEDLFERT